MSFNLPLPLHHLLQGCDSAVLPTPVIAKIRELPIKGPMTSTGRSPRVFDQKQAEIEYIPR